MVFILFFSLCGCFVGIRANKMASNLQWGFKIRTIQYSMAQSSLIIKWFINQMPSEYQTKLMILQGIWILDNLSIQNKSCDKSALGNLDTKKVYFLDIFSFFRYQVFKLTLCFSLVFNWPKAVQIWMVPNLNDIWIPEW